MDKNKIIIIVLIAVIVALLVGIVATMSVVDKTDTNVTYKGKSKIGVGDSINLKLTDVNGTPLANQTVNITITDKDNSSDYHSVVTNVNGVGKLKLDKSAGEYTVFINYGGNENYGGSNFTKKIVIEEEVVEAQTTSSSSTSSSSEPSDWTDSEGFHHFYENGKEYVGSREGQHMDIETHNYVKVHGME